MDRTPDEKREILREFIRSRKGTSLPSGAKFNIQAWSKIAGVNANSLYNFQNGHSDGLDLRTYAKLARAAGVPIHQLTGDMPEPSSPTAVWVVGQVEAGAFVEAVQWDHSRWYEVDVPVPSRFRGKAKALQVRGPSMDMEYPDGSIVVWVDMLDFRPVQDGDHVIVYSYKRDDGIEATVKELRIQDGRMWLWPRSHHPQHQAPIETANPPEDIREIVIKGIVIGGYRPRIN